MAMRLDSHHHVWDAEDLPFTWMVGERAALAVERPASAYRDAAVDAGLDGSVLVEAGDPAQCGSKLLRWADEDLGILGVVVAAPDAGLLSADLPDYLDRLAAARGGQKLVGIRWSGRSALGPGWFEDERVGRALDTLARRRLALDTIAFSEELAPLARAMRRRDDVDIVLDHLAKPPLGPGERSEDAGRWKRGIDALADVPRVAVKVSGLLHRARGDGEVDVSASVRHALSALGADRLMLGSDWPVCTLTADVDETVRRLGQAFGPVDPQQRGQVDGGTAARVYRLARVSFSAG